MTNKVMNAIRNITFTLPASTKEWLVVLGIVCGIVSPILGGRFQDIMRAIVRENSW